MEAFGLNGRDCKELLERLAFQYDDQEGTWTLPSPPEVHDRLNADGESLRELLEDVEYELIALMSRTAAEFNIVNPAAAEGWFSADRDLQRTLSAQGCKCAHAHVWLHALLTERCRPAICFPAENEHSRARGVSVCA